MTAAPRFAGDDITDSCLRGTRSARLLSKVRTAAATPLVILNATRHDMVGRRRSLTLDVWLTWIADDRAPGRGGPLWHHPTG